MIQCMNLLSFLYLEVVQVYFQQVEALLEVLLLGPVHGGHVRLFPTAETSGHCNMDVERGREERAAVQYQKGKKATTTAS